MYPLEAGANIRGAPVDRLRFQRVVFNNKRLAQRDERVYQHIHRTVRSFPVPAREGYVFGGRFESESKGACRRRYGRNIQLLAVVVVVVRVMAIVYLGWRFRKS